MFLEMSLDDLRLKLIERETLTGDDFDKALVEVETEGLVADNVLTVAGKDAYASEYLQYFTDTLDKVPVSRKGEIESARDEFLAKHLTEVALR